jgi:hypothetical protein
MVGRITPEKVVSLNENEVFVFESSLNGKHSKGTAKIALQKFNAKWGQPDGLQGKSYGIPVKDRAFNMLSFPEIEYHVRKFISFAKNNPNLIFLVPEIGCGFPGVSSKKIASLFEKAKDISNIYLPKRFWLELKK